MMSTLKNSHLAGRATSQRAMRGVSLIEVLITIVVLSIGLLGLAGLQATGTKFNHSAYMRSQATNLAYDMADRMRANRAAALANAYVLDADDPPPAGAEVAQLDLQQWRAELAARLPAGAGGVTALGSDQFEIEVRWDNSRLQNEALLESFVMRTGI